MGPFRIIGIQGDSVTLLSMETGKTKAFHRNRVSLAPFKESFLDDSDEPQGTTKNNQIDRNRVNDTIENERVKQEECSGTEEEGEEEEGDEEEGCLLYTSPSPRDRG